MATVGVRQFKNQLSRYLREVKKGKAVTVTERGEPIALVVPAQEPPEVKAAREMVAKGLATWNGGKPKGSARPVRARGKPVSEIVLEDRR